jgi:hypothetical protein
MKPRRTTQQELENIFAPKEKRNLTCADVMNQLNGLNN